MTTTTTTELPRFIPCPEAGITGATIERGPRKGRCKRQAERMDGIHGTYYRCPSHGTIDPAPILDPATIFRRLDRGPDNCRRCGQPTNREWAGVEIIARNCPHCGHRVEYPVPIEVPDQDQLVEPDP